MTLQDINKKYSTTIFLNGIFVVDMDNEFNKETLVEIYRTTDRNFEKLLKIFQKRFSK